MGVGDRYHISKLTEVLDGRPFRFYDSVASTNDIARDWQLVNPGVPSGAVVIADEQVGGRGRMGRQWLTPPGQAIAMSVILNPRIDPDDLHRVTILAGISVAEAIRDHLSADSDISLKWPNDVFLNGKKVCGILTEAIWIGNDLQAVIVGMGINVRVNFEGTAFEERATSIEDHTAHCVSRTDLIMTVLKRLDYWEEHIRSPLILDTYLQWLHTLGQTVCYQTINGQIEGIAKDVDASGALFIEDHDGKLHRILVGDISVG